MDKIYTLYDDLEVTRNAPPEVIRAAYRTLAEKYHPDKHPGNRGAEKLTASINRSYLVLSDPITRAEYDQLIHQQESSAQATGSSVLQPSITASSMLEPITQRRSHYEPAASAQSSASVVNGLVAHVFGNWLLYGFASLLIWLWVTDKPTTPSPGPKPYQASPAPAVPVEVRPVAAPNGQPWPVVAGYIKGYQQLHSDGLSTVTVDNSRNDSEVFVKLVSLNSSQAYPVRQFYIPAFGSFTLKQVTAGSYDIRHRDLSSGGLSRSEAIVLSEVHTGEETQYSKLTMTLYKIKNGNMQTYRLSEAEF